MRKLNTHKTMCLKLTLFCCGCPIFDWKFFARFIMTKWYLNGVCVERVLPLCLACYTFRQKVNNGILWTFSTIYSVVRCMHSSYFIDVCACFKTTACVRLKWFTCEYIDCNFINIWQRISGYRHMMFEAIVLFCSSLDCVAYSVITYKWCFFLHSIPSIHKPFNFFFLLFFFDSILRFISFCGNSNLDIRDHHCSL